MASASKTLLGLGQRLTRRVPPRIAPLRCQRAYRPKNKRLSSQQEADEELPDGVQKIFTAFPCRMHYYTLTGRSKLFDGRSKHHRLITRDLPPDAVLPGEDGLVRQAVGLIWPSDPKQTPISNGATWLPNTIWMQRLARQYHEEYYYKLLERGRELEEPQILTIKKTTPVPKELTLLWESDEWFSLQPVEAMTIADLNNVLNKFYDEHARKQNAEEWFEKNPPTRWMDGRYVDVWMDE